MQHRHEIHTDVEPTVYEFALIQVKPEYILQFFTKGQEKNKIYERYNVKTHGFWLAEAGTVGTFFVLREYPSLTHRVETRQKLTNDQEFQRLYREVNPMIDSTQSFLCKTPPNMPIKPFNTNGKHLIVHKLKPKKFSVFAAQKYREMVNDINTMVGTDLMNPIATLYPIVYDEFCMITLWEVPDNKLDTTYNKLVECRRDPTKWEKISEFQETYVDDMNVLALPVNPTTTPRLAF